MILINNSGKGTVPEILAHQSAWLCLKAKKHLALFSVSISQPAQVLLPLVEQGAGQPLGGAAQVAAA